MVDLYGKDKGNISLPLKLQSWDDGADKNQPTIINMQRTFYSIKIADIESRIKRLENRNDELLEEIEVINEHSSAVDADTADEIANLCKQVCSQTNHVENLNDQIDTVENDRIKNKQNHHEKIESFNQLYKEKKIELVSQIKVLNAKINSLEDFKRTQTALEEKYRTSNECMRVNEEKVKEVLRTISRKIEFDKETLKNEMYSHLLDLAAKFQIETNKQITLPNQRLMRENILLKNEVTQMSNEISVKKGMETNLKDSTINYKKNISKQLSNTKQNIVTIKIQDSVLKCLKKKIGNMNQHVHFVKAFDPAVETKYLMLIENLRQIECKSNFQLSKFRTLLHKEKTKISITKYMQRKVECKIKALVETFYDLKYIVICMRQVLQKIFLKKFQSSNHSNTIMLKNSANVRGLGYTELLLFLEKALIKGQDKLECAIIESVETIPREIRINAESLKEVPEEVEISTESEETESSHVANLYSAILRKEPDVKKLSKSSASEEQFEVVFEDTIQSDTNLGSSEFIEDWNENDSEDE